MLAYAYTGLGKDNDIWRAVVNGKFESITGIVYNDNAYWYVKEGILDTTFTGTVEQDGKTYNVVRGKAE